MHAARQIRRLVVHADDPVHPHLAHRPIDDEIEFGRALALNGRHADRAMHGVFERTRHAMAIEIRGSRRSRARACRAGARPATNRAVRRAGHCSRSHRRRDRPRARIPQRQHQIGMPRMKRAERRQHDRVRDRRRQLDAQRPARTQRGAANAGFEFVDVRRDAHTAPVVRVAFGRRPQRAWCTSNGMPSAVSSSCTVRVAVAREMPSACAARVNCSFRRCA